MTRTASRLVLAATLVAAALLLAACSSSGSDSSDKDAKTTTTKADTGTTDPGDDGTSTTEAADPAAQARADSVDLTVSDFADGWTAEPHEDSGDEDSPITACDPAFGDENKLASNATDDFILGSLDSGDGTQFSAQTVVYPTAAEADAAVEVLNDDDVVSCINEALKELFAGSSGATVTGDLADDDLDVGTDNSAGVSATYTITASDGSTAPATVATMIFATGDIATRVVVLSIGDSLDSTQLADPIQTLAELQGQA